MLTTELGTRKGALENNLDCQIMFYVNDGSWTKK
jgi:hypothetical protein